MSTRRQAGLTLVEVIIFIVVVSVGVAGILGVMGVVTGRSADPGRMKQAQMIAEAVMEELTLAPITYCEPSSANYDTAANVAACATAEDWGPEAGDTRPYDNLNDYATSSTAVMSYDTNVNGTAFPAGFSTTVNIAPVAMGSIGAAGTAADSEVFKITVTVTFDNQSIVLYGYRTRYAPNSA
jgi:MSHA pilin protein MshD